MTRDNIINKIHTDTSNKNKMILVNGQQKYVCSVCGRVSHRKKTLNGNIYCIKHYIQVQKHGSPTDLNCNSNKDKNLIIVHDKTAHLFIYDINNNCVGCAIIDKDDVDLVRNIRWSPSGTGYIRGRLYSGGKEQSVYLHRYLLKTDKIIDHINHNKYDNRRCNLRECSTAKNNRNKINTKGVRKIENGTFIARIKMNKRTLHLGCYDVYNEALFARWVAEKELFKECCIYKPEPYIPRMRKEEIYNYVLKKVQRL